MNPINRLRRTADLLRRRTLDDELLMLSEHPLLARQAKAAVPDGMRQLAILLDRALALRRIDLARHAGPRPAP